MYRNLFHISKTYFFVVIQFVFGVELLCMRFFFDTVIGFYIFSIIFFYGVFDNSGSIKEIFALIFYTYQIGICMCFFLIFLLPFSRKYAVSLLKDLPPIIGGDLWVLTFFWRVVKCWGFLLFVVYIELHTTGLNFATEMAEVQQLQTSFFLNEYAYEQAENALNQYINTLKAASEKKGVVFETVHFIKTFLKN